MRHMRIAPSDDDQCNDLYDPDRRRASGLFHNAHGPAAIVCAFPQYAGRLALRDLRSDPAALSGAGHGDEYHSDDDADAADPVSDGGEPWVRPIWFGVIMVIMMEMGQITPPVGINVFVIHGVAKKYNVSMATIYRGIIPIVIVEVVVIFFLTLFPDIVLWLPNSMDTLAQLE